MKPRSRKLTKAEAEAMLASGDWQEDAEYWEPGHHGMTGYKSAKNAGLLVTRRRQSPFSTNREKRCFGFRARPRR